MQCSIHELLLTFPINVSVNKDNTEGVRATREIDDQCQKCLRNEIVPKFHTRLTVMLSEAAFTRSE